MAKVQCSKAFWTSNSWVLLSNLMNPILELNINYKWKKIPCKPYTFPLVTTAEEENVSL